METKLKHTLLGFAEQLIKLPGWPRLCWDSSGIISNGKSSWSTFVFYRDTGRLRAEFSLYIPADEENEGALYLYIYKENRGGAYAKRGPLTVSEAVEAASKGFEHARLANVREPAQKPEWSRAIFKNGESLLLVENKGEIDGRHQGYALNEACPVFLDGDTCRRDTSYYTAEAGNPLYRKVFEVPNEWPTDYASVLTKFKTYAIKATQKLHIARTPHDIMRKLQERIGDLWACSSYGTTSNSEIDYRVELKTEGSTDRRRFEVLIPCLNGFAADGGITLTWWGFLSPSALSPRAISPAKWTGLTYDDLWRTLANKLGIPCEKQVATPTEAKVDEWTGWDGEWTSRLLYSYAKRILARLRTELPSTKNEESYSLGSASIHSKNINIWRGFGYNDLVCSLEMAPLGSTAEIHIGSTGGRKLLTPTYIVAAENEVVAAERADHERRNKPLSKTAPYKYTPPYTPTNAYDLRKKKVDEFCAKYVEELAAIDLPYTPYGSTDDDSIIASVPVKLTEESLAILFQLQEMGLINHPTTYHSGKAVSSSEPIKNVIVD